MKKIISHCFIVLALAAASGATELTDLGRGLSYLRVSSVSESAKAIVASVPQNRPFVLDLRYVTATDEDSRLISGALAKRTGTLPLFILISPETPPAVAQALSRLPVGTITLGVEGSAPVPTVVVAQATGTDRRAYDAARDGLALETLISGKINKERFDEASLVRDFQNGHAYPSPPSAPDWATKPDTQKPQVLTDRVLQRAVHLHRTLVALRPRGA